MRTFDPGELSEATYLPDGKGVLTVGADGLMRLWDADRGTEVIRDLIAAGRTNAEIRAEFDLPDPRFNQVLDYLRGRTAESV